MKTETFRTTAAETMNFNKTMCWCSPPGRAHGLISCLCVEFYFAVEVSRAEEEPVSVSPELSNWIKLNSKNLKIRQTDRSWAAEVVNDFRDNLLKFLRSNSDQPLFRKAEFLTTGSYFEKVKVRSRREQITVCKGKLETSRYSNKQMPHCLISSDDTSH